MKCIQWLRSLLLLAVLCFGSCMTGGTVQGEGAAEKLNILPTTYPAVAFTFGGLSKGDVVDDVLNRMDREGMRGPFFVTERELKRNGPVIANIARHGQEFGIGILYKEGDTEQAIEAQIIRIRQGLAAYGATPKFMRQMYGADSPAVAEAVRRQQGILVGQTKNMVLSRLKDAQSADDIMKVIFKKWDFALGRGQIAYFRLDYLTHPMIIGDVVSAVKRDKVDNVAYRTFTDSPETNGANDSAYAVLSLGDIWSHADMRWTYPVDESCIPEALKPDTIAVPVTKKNFTQTFLARYIGAPEVDAEDRMYGFGQGLIAAADKTGVIKTVHDNTVFLTFDDWGTDESINKLLYVLRKHHVKATFFIITRYMPSNPNLLRAIALEGHDIGSHTDLHQAMSIRDEKGKIIDSQTPEAYQKNVADSYKKLADTIGDVQVDGTYALTRLFRPPTLAVNESGSMALFNAGYTYIVSGYESTEDYAARSISQVVGAIRAGMYTPKGNVRRGSVIVMHMSSTAPYTAQALDIVLTKNEELADRDPKKVKFGRLSAYLRDGYDQRQEQPKYESYTGMTKRNPI